MTPHATRYTFRVPAHTRRDALKHARTQAERCMPDGWRCGHSFASVLTSNGGGERNEWEVVIHLQPERGI